MKSSLLKYNWPVLVIGLLGIMPFVLSRQLNDPVRYPQLLVLATVQLVVLGMCLGRVGEQGLRKLALPLGAWRLMLVWMGFHLLGLLQAINLAEGLFETLQSGLLVGAFLLFSYFLQTEKSPWPLLVKVVTLATGLQALWAIGQVVAPDLFPGGFKGMPTGTHANPNQLAAALVLVIPLLVWGILRLPMTWKMLGGLAIALLLPAAYLSGARSAWMVLLLWAVLVPIYALPMLWKRPRQRKLFWGVTVLCVLGLVATYQFSSQVNYQKKGTMNFHYMWDSDIQIQAGHSSLEHRMIVWNRSMDMVAEYPLLGVGPGNWKVMIPKYGIKGFDDAGRYGMDYSIRPHNEFLQVAAELGLGGLLCFLLILGGAGWLLFRVMRKGKNEPMRTDGFLLLLAGIGVLLFAMFSFPRERPYSGTLMALYLALALDLGRRAGLSRVIAQTRLPLAYLLAAFVLVAGIVIGLRMRSDAAILELRQAKAAKKWPLVARLAGEAGHPLNTIDPVSAAPLAWFQGIAQLSTGQHADGLQSMREAARIAPYHLAVRTNLAAALELNGQHQEAAQAYHALLGAFPDFEESWLNLAIVYLHLGDPEQVRACLAQVSPETTDPKYQIIQNELAKLRP